MRNNAKNVCISKASFETEYLVKEYINFKNLNSNRDFYKCVICEKYHICKTKIKSKMQITKDYKREKKLKKIIFINKIRKNNSR